MADPHLRMCEVDLPGPVADAQSFATLATKLVLEEVTKGKMTYLALVTFVKAKARFWQLHDAPAEQVDDIVRTIAREEGVDGLAFVYPMPLPKEVDADRGYNVSAECATGKFDSLIALKGGTPPGGEQFRLYGRKVDGVTRRWFGVTAENHVDVWMEGIVGAVIKGGEA